MPTRTKTSADKAEPLEKSKILSVSCEISDAYSGISGREHSMPRIITLSNAVDPKSDYGQVERAECLDMLRRGYDGEYKYSATEGGRVFVNDYDDYSRVKQTLSHEFVHHVRRVGGASSEFDAVDSIGITKLSVIRSLEEGCAVFMQGAYCMQGRKDPESVLDAVFEVFDSKAIAMLPQTYRMVKEEGISVKFSSEVSNDALASIIGTHGNISFNENNSFKSNLYSAGTSFAAIVYAANEFDFDLTGKKLLTNTFDELKRELREAAGRADVEDAINSISNKLKDKRQS